jgi:hypothetical protein
MTSPAGRRSAWVATGAVGTLVVAGAALLLLKYGLDTTSKVAGIIGLFLSIGMAIWTIRQAKRARREVAMPEVSAPGAPGLPMTTSSPNPPSRSGSTFGNVTNNNPGKVVMGDHSVSMDHIVHDSTGRAGTTEPKNRSGE